MQIKAQRDKCVGVQGGTRGCRKGSGLLIACGGADTSVELNTWHTQSTETNPHCNRAQISAGLVSDSVMDRVYFGLLLTHTLLYTEEDGQFTSLVFLQL